jgi:hypothetical protein
MNERECTLEKLIEDLYYRYPEKPKLDKETCELVSSLREVAALLRVMPKDTARCAFDAAVAVARATKSKECVEKVIEIIKSYRSPTQSILFSGIMNVAEEKPPEAVVKHLKILTSPPVKEFISLVEKEEHPEIAEKVIEPVNWSIVLCPEEELIFPVLSALRNYKGKTLMSLAWNFYPLFMDVIEGKREDVLRVARALAKEEVVQAIRKYERSENFVEESFYIASNRINGESFLTLASRLLVQQDYKPDVATQILYHLGGIGRKLDALGGEGVKIYERICSILGSYREESKVERVAQLIEDTLFKYGMSKKFLELIRALEEGKPPEKVAKKYGLSYLFS